MKMGKIFLALLVAVLSLCAISCVSPAFAGGVNDGWKIDSDLKFNFGYLPPAKNVKNISESKGKDVEKPSDMGLSKPYLPDITNIALDGFIGMGFPVPAPADKGKYNLFIKLFTFPAAFKPEKSSLPIIEGYMLDKLESGKNIVEYASAGKNLAVKFCYVAKSDTVFSPENPFPSFIVKTAGESVQQIFNENTIYSSLYITPNAPAGEKSNDNELAKFSAGGVLAFHGELVKMYGEKLIHLGAPTGEDKHYFYGIRNASGGRQALTVVKVPKRPLVFENWRELPMPHDPAKIFLSGLLLLHKYDYALKDGVKDADVIAAVDSPEFNARFEKISAHVLEIASVVKLKK
ncbi:MAG TPA: hypothetical protein PKK26_15065 [Candidatus Wallbacteria bacterium]|nr:hypothetical protein [Candidatus Wallbacteria bacterium]